MIKKIFLMITCFVVTFYLLYRYDFFIVTSGSMKPTIDVGSMVVVDTKREIQNNDVITYKKNDVVVTHRLIDINNGDLITKGDANTTNDLTTIKINDVIGSVVLNIPIIGYFLVLIRNHLVIFVFVVILLIYLYGTNNKKTK